jgi:hypothetical protein
MKKWENMEKHFKKYCKIQSSMPIGVPRDLGAITKHMQTKKVSEPIFLITK